MEMKFENMWLGRPYKPDPKKEKIEMLWLWYEYNTEMFDRNLASSIPSEKGDGCVIPIHPEDKEIAATYARKMFSQMVGIASLYDISRKDLQSGGRHQYRHMNEVIGAYEKLMYTDKMDFIFNCYHPEGHKAVTPILHAVECACEECRYKKGDMFEHVPARKQHELFKEPSQNDKIVTQKFVLMQKLAENGRGIVYYYREM